MATDLDMARWELDVCELFKDATGHATLMPFQVEFLRARDPQLALAISRQGSKSTMTAIKAIHVSMFYPGSLSLLAAPGQNQAAELLHKIRTFYKEIGSPCGSYGDSTTKLEFPSGSRIMALSGNPETTRGYTGPRLLIIDEAARTTDELLQALRPMRASSPVGSQFICLSTPRGVNNWFYRDIFSPDAQELGNWRTWQVHAEEIAFLNPVFLASEKSAMSHDQYEEEYGASFLAFSGSAFDPNWVIEATTSTAQMWNF